MVITTSRPKGADGQRSTRYSVHYDGEQVALVTFSDVASAALVARFLSGADLTGDLQERAVELLDSLEGGEQGDGE